MVELETSTPFVENVTQSLNFSREGVASISI